MVNRCKYLPNDSPLLQIEQKHGIHIYDAIGYTVFIFVISSRTYSLFYLFFRRLTKRINESFCCDDDIFIMINFLPSCDFIKNCIIIIGFRIA